MARLLVRIQWSALCDTYRTDFENPYSKAGTNMNKGVKFRAYPNKEQQNLINQTFGCCRLIYNKGLAMRNDAYTNG